MNELFEKLLPIFLENGGKLFDFYIATYGEINAVINANRKRVKQEFQMAATVAYQTARLNSYAFADASKMPPLTEVFPKLFDDIKAAKPKQQDWRVMLDIMSSYADQHNNQWSASHSAGDESSVTDNI